MNKKSIQVKSRKTVYKQILLFNYDVIYVARDININTRRTTIALLVLIFKVIWLNEGNRTEFVLISLMKPDVRKNFKYNL